MRYSKYLTGAVGKRIEDLHQRQQVALSLLDEVSVMQELAGQAVANYERAFEKSQTIEDLEQRMRIQNAASGYLIEVLNQVRDMTVAAARVQDSGKAVDMQTLASVMSQMMAVMEEKARAQLVDPEMFLQDMAQVVQERFLTVEAVAKTTLTPARLDQQVSAMHNSVPSAPVAIGAA